ncbi:MAG: hydroxymethylbilane synthase [Planctomycetes bacterium]|nr:hydroxymethylbilane synthase [Planctomycetota bacterium]
MTTLRVGTRGSDLAMWQTNWVSDLLREIHPGLEIEQVIITTHGDTATDAPFDAASWPAGGFVGAIEQALCEDRIDFAVHSYKDLTTQSPEELIVAAVPSRAMVCDVLLTREAIELEDVGEGFRVGTSSPRRSAQMRRHAKVEIVPIRGNVPTRVKKLDTGDYDGVMLAAAGLKRLGIEPEHIIELPVDRFVPAPAQGAVAVQTKRETEAETIIDAIDDKPSHRGVRAERSFLKAIEAGCHTPVGALAHLEGDEIEIHGQLFSDDGGRMVEAIMTGSDPLELGQILAGKLKSELGDG